MSKLSELIKEKCPNGVPYKKLEELVDYVQPTKYIVKSTNYDDKYDVPVLTAGQTFILGYTDEQDGIYYANKYKPVIIFDDFTTSNHWVDFDFKVKSSAMKILIPKTRDIFKYVYYCICNIDYLPKEHSRQWIQTYSQLVIPIPPIEVQEEIVRVLDKFGELETELEMELEARRSQYEFWRGKLLSSKYPLERVRYLLRNYCSGSTPLKGTTAFYENGDIPWLRTQEVRFNEIYQTECFVTKYALEKTGVKYIPKNCVIVAMSGASAGRCAINKIPLTTNQHCLNLEIDSNKANYKYVYYCLCNSYNDLISKKEGARGDLNSSKILNQKIPYPPLEIQNKIVVILDKFDKLINDISGVLPAEIEARRNQYEYYRNKLLNFEED